MSAVLGFEGEPGCTRFLLTRDTNILLKARAKGLRADRLPEEWEVQAEPDPVEKELRETQRELASLKHRQPKISLSLVHGGQEYSHYVDVKVLDVRLPEDQEIEHLYASEQASCLSQQGRGEVLWALAQPTEAQVEEHLRHYREYLQTVTPLERRLGLRIGIGFALTNHGAAMAAKIELDVTAGAGVRFGYVADCPKAPRRPKLRSWLESLAYSQSYEKAGGFGPLGAEQWLARASRDGDIRVKPARVEYTLKDVMHSDRRLLSKFDVLLPDGWQAQGFALEVALRVAELPQPERLTFNVRTHIERRDPFSWPDDQ